MVLIVGGITSGPALASAELYNPATGLFTATGSLNNARYSHTATLLEDGRVLIAGGASSVNSILASAEIYDPNTGKFTFTGYLNVGRRFDSATRLPDGTVLIVGGESRGQFTDWQRRDL